MSRSLADYYQAPAPEFEIVYDKPERQADLANLRSWLADKARGTTYWKLRIAPALAASLPPPPRRSLRPTSIWVPSRSLARTALGPMWYLFRQMLMRYPTFGHAFDAGMARFWWSHVPIADQQRFLAHFASRATAGREAPHDRQHVRR